MFSLYHQISSIFVHAFTKFIDTHTLKSRGYNTSPNKHRLIHEICLSMLTANYNTLTAFESKGTIYYTI